jgi:hypothetical protein
MMRKELCCQAEIAISSRVPPDQETPKVKKSGRQVSSKQILPDKRICTLMGILFSEQLHVNALEGADVSKHAVPEGLQESACKVVFRKSIWGLTTSSLPNTDEKGEIPS